MGNILIKQRQNIFALSKLGNSRNSTPLHLTKYVGRKNHDRDFKSANSQQARLKAAVVKVTKCARDLTYF